MRRRGRIARGWFYSAKKSRSSPALGVPDNLVVNPGVSFLQPVPQPRAWLPAEMFFDQRVVAVASVDALGRFQIVTPLEFDPRDALDDVHELIDAHQFVAPQVQRLDD